MDVVLQVVDTFVLDRVYATLAPATNLLKHDSTIAGNATLTRTIPNRIEPATRYLQLEPSEYAFMSSMPRDNIYRQAMSLFCITWFFGILVYYIFATLSYYFMFDKSTMKHPKFLKNQIRKEMYQTNMSMPGMSIGTAALFLLEVRGYAKLYDAPSEAPFPLYNWLQFPLFLLFTDFWIYLIHRGLHHPMVYKTLHKPHHKWIVPTPFASHAFHPIDGFAQSLPYHIFPFVFPQQKLATVALFVFVNFWTISIHDGEHMANSKIINGAACHTIHHERFNYNYGQYTTIWDRFWGTYSQPTEEMFDPSKKGVADKQYLAKSVAEIEKMTREIEGEDDREYTAVESKKKM